MNRAACLALLLSFALPGSAAADLRLPAVIGSHMVVQRDSRAPLWGWAEPGESVVATASWGARASTTADERGRWQVELATPAAGGPHTIELRGRNTLMLDDVLSGEVWVCAGQSNMEQSVADVPPGRIGVPSGLPKVPREASGGEEASGRVSSGGRQARGGPRSAGSRADGVLDRGTSGARGRPGPQHEPGGRHRGA